jgi:hypothetical protein
MRPIEGHPARSQELHGVGSSQAPFQPLFLVRAPLNRSPPAPPCAAHCRWDAGQRLAMKLVLSLYAAVAKSNADPADPAAVAAAAKAAGGVSPALVGAFRAVLTADDIDGSFKVGGRRRRRARGRAPAPLPSPALQPGPCSQEPPTSRATFVHPDTTPIYTPPQHPTPGHGRDPAQRVGDRGRHPRGRPRACL